jgi:hypothetical protein
LTEKIGLLEVEAVVALAAAAINIVARLSVGGDVRERW